ncbi:molybdopterin-dependent oxidoreductase [Halomonas eurihalina]|uniref:Molybdopterin-dependent oxidoreductase n=1 Tax=Halomonas eurihalina TaxID=42566 RepID=A0A5D9D659_HALER|nr:molybdopterin-dependent oxidoreductase [Halomonas eurihalina]MDR5858930.1 molybdopterin-dependent oxidoreductase [Halomonas eurihalina]TZG39434.1 molybdopterin-dependent oxidoreductase [Halomonas eurihalina]
MSLRPVLAVIVGLVAAMGAAVEAAPLPSPSGEVLLTVRGNISRPNVGDEARFDRAMLDRLASRSIVTTTPWHPGPGRFEGPLFSALLDAVGANGSEVRVVALNGFEASIPISDFERYDVILAMRRNGQPMPIRDFGPLFVVYPFDQHPELRTEAIRFRSVWQVNRIFVY